MPVYASTATGARGAYNVCVCVYVFGIGRMRVVRLIYDERELILLLSGHHASQTHTCTYAYAHGRIDIMRKDSRDGDEET